MRLSCLAIAFALAGCSIIWSRSVASHGAEKCTTSVGPAAADTAVVAGAIAFGIYTKVETEDIDHITIPASIAVLLVYGISAGVGYARATACKRARIKEGIAY